MTELRARIELLAVPAGALLLLIVLVLIVSGRG